MRLLKYAAAFATTLAAAALPAGCARPGEINPQHQTIAAPADSISVYQLAGRLELRVARNSRTFALLRGPANSVTVYPAPGAAVYVNGQPLRFSGRIVAADSTIFVPEPLASLVRRCLRPRPAPPAPAVRPPQKCHVVVLDPGHGGRDPGAIACNGMFEKDVVLPTTLMVRQHLRQRGVKVVLTRSEDVFIDLERRAEIANEAECDLFVSIHADWCPRPWVQGHTVYVSRSASPESLEAAKRVDRQMGMAGISSRGVRRANYRVLVRTTCPAMLVEMGYLSNRAEARRLSTASHRGRIAKAIAAGIVGFLRR